MEVYIMSYKYENIELMPEIFAELLLQLFHNKQFKRQEAIDEIKKYHLFNGGTCDRKSYIETFKRATMMLRKKGYDVTNPSYGIWRIGDVSDGFVSYRDAIAMQINNSLTEVIDTQEEIGDGDEVVYVYYYPVYKKYALMQRQNCWHCKVGMTTKTVWDRIYPQSSTGFPEEPVVGLIIKCFDARTLEQIIHNILKRKNKWIEKAPGKEWFITSPSEVKSIYESICN